MKKLKLEKLKLEGKALTREQMKRVGGGDGCDCIVPYQAWLCISSGCSYTSDGFCHPAYTGLPNSN
jgi:hypothetical protein